jgi:aryl-alcohol dehydrogenase-like predicted oxidoreductase
LKLEALRKKIVLGTVQLGLKYGINNVAGKPTRSDAFGILDKALQSNINTLDTADAYGDAIQVIGDYLRSNPGANFTIITKFTYDAVSMDQKVDASLKALQCESLYGYMYHRFDDYRNRYYRDDLLRLRHQGLIGKIGASVYSMDELAEVVNDSEVDLIQIPFNLFDNSTDKRQLLEQAKKLGKEIHVRSIFLQGLFFKQPNELSGNLKRLEQPVREFHAILDQFSLNVNQACLNHALHNPLIDKVLIGVETVSQLEENLESILSDFPAGLSEKLESISIPDKRLLNPTNWEP